MQEATNLVAVEGVDRSYMQRVVGIYLLIRLVDQRFGFGRFSFRRRDYDEVVGVILFIFLTYRRIVFQSKRGVAGRKGGIFDYRCQEYLAIRNWINTRAPKKTINKISFHSAHPFKMRNGKLEANEESEDYGYWMAETGEPPYG